MGKRQPRKSNYDNLVDSISKRLREMAPENCSTIEEAVRNDQTLFSTGLVSHVSTVDDYSHCPTCNRVCWHGVCQVCP